MSDVRTESVSVLPPSTRVDALEPARRGVRAADCHDDAKAGAEGSEEGATMMEPVVMYDTSSAAPPRICNSCGYPDHGSIACGQMGRFAIVVDGKLYIYGAPQ